MKHSELAVIFPVFEDVETVRSTLPSVIEECRRAGSALIVHDASVERSREMRAFLDEVCSDSDTFLIYTSPVSMAAARNMCLDLAISLYSPLYVCMLEDDHGLRKGAITEMIHAMQDHYGRPSTNGLRFGLFSGCIHCWRDLHAFEKVGATSHLQPCQEVAQHALGGVNSCFRCAPTSHWVSVLKGYDTDEYMISNWQTRNVNFRNYNRGFTAMYVGGGDLAFTVDRVGQGYTQQPGRRRWDEAYTASDPRSDYFGKPTLNAEGR